MTYSRFQHCRNLRKEIVTLESKLQKHHSSKNYEKIKLAKQTLAEAKAEYEKAAQEIQNWLTDSPLTPIYKESCAKYYIKAHAKHYIKATYEINNMERELKRCLGEE